jgi:hypothetical protein
LINNSTGTIFTLPASAFRTFMVDYSIFRTDAYRTGTIMVAAAAGTNILQFTDTNYVQNASVGFVLNVAQNGSDITLDYSDATPTGVNGEIAYSIRTIS